MSADAIFPRRFDRHYPFAVRGEGIYLFDEFGNRYMDAIGGAAVVSIGHGVKEIVDRVHEQAKVLSYAHTSQFHTRAAVELAERLRSRFPGSPQSIRVHFTSGGSESTETAIKVVRQYWINRGQPERYKILSRWQSYHGATLGALALSGRQGSRAPYLPMLPEVDHISPCHCYHCPFGREFPGCDLACARELAARIEAADPESVAAFIVEPVVGATTGAPPPDGYLQLVREICDRYDILLIADEVMTGVGRTGRYFAVEHWGVVPDIILLGKGLTSGYMPLGAVLVGEKVWTPISQGAGTLNHGFTYMGHPPSVAAGVAVQDYLDKHSLIDRASERGAYLADRLRDLLALQCVGDVRGKGLLQTVEFVADKATREPFPDDFLFSERLFEQLRDQGVLVHPMKGATDGVAGDHILLAPPFIIDNQEIDWLVDQIESAVEKVYERVLQPAGLS